MSGNRQYSAPLCACGVRGEHLAEYNRSDLRDPRVGNSTPGRVPDLLSLVSAAFSFPCRPFFEKLPTKGSPGLKVGGFPICRMNAGHIGRLRSTRAQWPMVRCRPRGASSQLTLYRASCMRFVSTPGKMRIRCSLLRALSRLAPHSRMRSSRLISSGCATMKCSNCPCSILLIVANSGPRLQVPKRPKNHSGSWGFSARIR